MQCDTKTEIIKLATTKFRTKVITDILKIKTPVASLTIATIIIATLVLIAARAKA